MANRFPGACTHCGQPVPAGAGNFERRAGRFLVRCRSCISAGRNDYGNLGREAATFKEPADADRR